MATKSIAWQTGGGRVTLTYQGQGDGTIDVSSDDNTLGSARSMTIVVQTTNGAITRNLSINQASCPFPIGEVRNFQYTGEVQSVELPAGRYKLQCWGAQGGTVTRYDGGQYVGGKGGYSEGVLSLTSKTTVYIFVGGQGSSSGNGGWNCGGGSSGTSSYDSGNENGESRMGCGGGATDIALVTSTMSYSSRRNNRSSASLLSRMIVAGGGSGGSAVRKTVTSSVTTDTTVADNEYIDGIWVKEDGSVVSNRYRASTDYIPVSEGDVLSKYTVSGGDTYVVAIIFDSSKTARGNTGPLPYTVPSDIKYIRCVRFSSSDYSPSFMPASVTISHTEQQTTTYYYGLNGMAGGGTNGQGYNTSEEGKQTSAGTNGEFGKGANQSTTYYRYCSGAGGGGWYGGGGGLYSDSDIYTAFHHGGGSGFVNTVASAGDRPAGYTGLQLDSGSTYDGRQTFKAPSGSNETGHSGNGYARITRLS